MLTEDRRKLILDILKEKKSITVLELVEKLDSSESTIRRDLIALDKMNKLQKVHGGAVMLNRDYTTEEFDVVAKHNISLEEKTIIAQYAAKLIKENDFVFLDAGTTTEIMIDYIEENRANYITNGIVHAKKLAQRGFKVSIVAGEIKSSTEAIVGFQAVNSLKNYNFTKGFFGTNAISEVSGYSTPDINEGIVKEEALKRCRESYVLADIKKFNKISSYTFGDIKDSIIITKEDTYKYKKYTKIIEVM